MTESEGLIVIAIIIIIIMIGTLSGTIMVDGIKRIIKWIRSIETKKTDIY